MKWAHGGSRSVLLISRYALKFPSFISWRQFLWGLLSNMAEGQKERKEYLCPTLYSNRLGLLNIMPRCEPVPDEFDMSKVDPELYRSLGFDTKPDSLGYLDGKIVGLDYHDGV